MILTVKEIAEKLGTGEDAVRGLVKFMLCTDPPIIRCRGERVLDAGSGHGPKVYEVDADAAMILAEEVQKLI